MKTLSFPFQVFSLSVILIFLSGCETTAPQSKVPPPDAIAIERGAPVATLIEKMGEPYQKSTIEKSGATAEIWAYKRKVNSRTQMVMTDTRDVPYIDQDTGEIKMIQEPIYTQETSSDIQITKFLIVDERIISWKHQIFNEGSSFN